MSNRGRVPKAQAAPAAKHEVCERKDVEQRRRQSKVCKAFWTWAAVAIFGSAVPRAVAITVQTSADHSGAPDADLENLAIGRMATCVHRAEFQQPSADGQCGGGKMAAGSNDAAAEWRQGDPRVVQGANALARPLASRNGDTLERGVVEASPDGKRGWWLRVVASNCKGPYGPPRGEGLLKRRRYADRTRRRGRLRAKRVAVPFGARARGGWPTQRHRDGSKHVRGIEKDSSTVKQKRCTAEQCSRRYSPFFCTLWTP